MLEDFPTDYFQSEVRSTCSYVEDLTEVFSNDSTNNRNELISKDKNLKKKNHDVDESIAFSLPSGSSMRKFRRISNVRNDLIDPIEFGICSISF